MTDEIFMWVILIHIAMLIGITIKINLMEETVNHLKKVDWDWNAQRSKISLLKRQKSWKITRAIIFAVLLIIVMPLVILTH